MRIKDREVCVREEIEDILERCDTLSIGFQGGDYPYVVPVSFGTLHKEDVLYIYFHSGREGLKVEYIEKSPKVCVEGHIFRGVEKTQNGITTRFESVIGFGTVEKMDGDEKIKGLRLITAHYGHPDYPADRCRGLDMTSVYRIKIESLTGKRNLNR